MTPEPKTTRQNAEEAIRHIVGDPNCKRSGCHGKGYTGILFLPDGSVKVDTCVCGRIGKTDYVVLYAKLKDIQDSIASVEASIEQMTVEVFRHTFYGGLKVFWGRIVPPRKPQG